MSAWCKYYLGWSDLTNIDQAGAVDFFPVMQDNEMYRIVIPGTQYLEYFLIEYRRNGQHPSGGTNWDEFLPASGLAIWHVDERVGAASPLWPFTNADQGQNDSPVRFNPSPPPMYRDKHPLLYLVQADGKVDLDRRQNPSNRGDAGDLFTSGNFEDDSSGKKGSRAYAGQSTGIAVKSINVSPNKVTGTVAVAGGVPPSHLAAALPLQLPPVSDDIKSKLKDIESKIRPLLKGESIPDKWITQITAEEQKTLASLNAPSFFQALPPDAASALWQTASQLKSRTIEMATEPKTQIESAVKSLLAKSESPTSAELRYDDNEDRAVQVTGLRVKAALPTLGDDAVARLSEPDLKKALGLGDLSLVTTTSDKGSQLQRFRQIHKVGDLSLPILNSRVALHYDKERRLVAATADIAPSDLNIVGADVALDATAARKLAAEAFGLPLETISLEPEKGLFVTRESPQSTNGTGRVVYRVTIAQGEHRAPLIVYLDAESKRVFFSDSQAQ